MANFFPCPNPACTYQFDADQLPAAAMVTCPICRTRFPYRATNQPTQEISAEHQSHVAEEGDEQHSDTAYSGGTSAPPRERANRLITPRDLPKKNKSQTILMIAGFAAVLVTVLIVVIMASRKTYLTEDDSGEEYVEKTFNFQFVKFDRKSWKEDKVAQRTIPLNGFLLRLDRDSEPAAYIGLWCQDYKDRNPSERELGTQLHKIVDRFGRVQKEATSAKIAGQSVDGVHFSNGSLDGVTMEGEAFALANKGIAYVLVMWSPQDKWDSAKSEIYPLRDRFKFASVRENWTERGGSTTATHFVEGGEYQLDDADRLWVLGSDPKSEDDKATMRFSCKHPSDAKVGKPRYVADVLVLVFDKGGMTFDDVKKHVLAQRNKSGPDFTVDTYPSPPFKTSVPANGGIFRVTSTTDRTLKYFYAINILEVGGKSVAAVGWCREVEYAELMGPYIMSFISSLKAR